MILTVKNRLYNMGLQQIFYYIQYRYVLKIELVADSNLEQLSGPIGLVAIKGPSDM
jgi:hypothetical protein